MTMAQGYSVDVFRAPGDPLALSTSEQGAWSAKVAKHAKIRISKSFARFASFADPCCSGAEYPALYRKQRAPREAGL